MDNSNVAIDETNRLIASNKVEGAAVYSRDGERLGSVHNFMVDKRSGKTEYAVMSFGGILGLGEEYHPLPWDQLTYDTSLGGYTVDLDREKLERGPRYKMGEEPAFSHSYGRDIYSYYGMMYPY